MNVISTNSQNSREKILTAVPWVWVALAAIWAVVIFTTDEGGGPLAIWIAITLGPIAVLQSRLHQAKADQQPNNHKDSK